MRIVAVNADNICATKARLTCADLIPDFGHNFEFDYSWWSFEELSVKEEFNIAVSETHDADMVVIASRADEELPPIVRACLEMALIVPGRPDRTLIALLEDGFYKKTGKPSPLEHYLRRIAQRAGMDFLAEWFEPTDLPPANYSTEIPPKPGITSAPYETPSHPGDYREWGIND